MAVDLSLRPIDVHHVLAVRFMLAPRIVAIAVDGFVMAVAQRCAASRWFLAGCSLARPCAFRAAVRLDLHLFVVALNGAILLTLTVAL